MNMQGIIKVSTAKLTITANAFSATGNQIKSITTQMTVTVNTLSGSIWNGDAANAYKKKFNGLQDDINRMVKMIQEHVKDLNNMAREYEQTEASNINLGNSLSDDVIH